MISFLAPFWVLPTMLLSGSVGGGGHRAGERDRQRRRFRWAERRLDSCKTTTGGDTGALLSLSAMAFVAASFAWGCDDSCPNSPRHAELTAACELRSILTDSRCASGIYARRSSSRAPLQATKSAHNRRSVGDS